MGFRTSALLALLAAGVCLSLAGPAQANVLTRSDGNDTRGPLDIRSASHGHAGSLVTHTIRTFAPWSKAVVGPRTPNAFAVFVSTDGDAAPERIVLAFSSGGRMVALVVRPNGSLIGRAAAVKPNGRTVRMSIPRARLGSPAGYRWQAFSYFETGTGRCANGCLDRVPNATARVLHDIRAPLISFPAPPGISTATTYDVAFSVSDTGGSGLQSWRLEHRLLGSPTWSTATSGTTVGAKTHSFQSAENADDQFRVVAVDRHGNTTVSPVRFVSVPLDDQALTYGGAWSGTGALATDFMATRQSSSEVNATASYTFTGDYVAWIAPGGGPGIASVSIDGLFQASVDLSLFGGPQQVVFERSSLPTPGPMHTILITVDSGTAPVDGIVVR